jgi:3-phosphoshikimate 1-carboxyvinyltransferase
MEGPRRRYRVRGPTRPLRGRVRVPSDKSITHRALLFAGLAEGQSVLRGFGGGLDNLATLKILQQMGVGAEVSDDRVTIEGVGLHGLQAPDDVLDCGNSGTTMRLSAGLLSAQPFPSTLVGDASLSARPMMRIIGPLRARGATLDGVPGPKEDERYAPLRISPLPEGRRLSGLEYRPPIASAQVKSALLLSGLYADGPTAVAEPEISRDHTERMMQAVGIPLRSVGPVVILEPEGWSGRWEGVDWELPGDPSSAAFLIAAALVVPASQVTVEHVGLNPTRAGFLEALIKMMRAPVSAVPRGEACGNEPVGALMARHGVLAPARVGGELVTRMIDEVPIFATLATRGRGRTDVRDARELRVKESDRLRAITEVLTAFGQDVVELDDGLHVHGGAKVVPATVDSRGDHRIAMSAAVLALAAEGESVIEDVACVETSFPGFAEALRSLGADITVEEA